MYDASFKFRSNTATLLHHIYNKLLAALSVDGSQPKITLLIAVNESRAEEKQVNQFACVVILNGQKCRLSSR